MLLELAPHSSPPPRGGGMWWHLQGDVCNAGHLPDDANTASSGMLDDADDNAAASCDQHRDRDHSDTYDPSQNDNDDDDDDDDKRVLQSPPPTATMTTSNCPATTSPAADNASAAASTRPLPASAAPASHPLPSPSAPVPVRGIGSTVGMPPSKVGVPLPAWSL